MAPLSRALALLLSAAIVASAPGSAAFAAELTRAAGEPSIPALPSAALAPELAPGSAPAAPAGIDSPAASAAGAPAASAEPAAAGQAVSAESQAAALGQAASQGDAGADEAAYDNARTGLDVPLVEPPRALGLSASDLDQVVAFTAGLQKKAAEKFPEAGFHKRDYISWRNFIRFYTPEYGLKEALKRGALYVYRDRLETDSERASFDTLLTEELGKLSLSDPNHGKNAQLAKELMARAEPAAIETPADEASPFNMPLSELIPDAERSKLVMTPTVLNRLDSVMQSFALRDYALLVGPPAAVKSALPRYIASHFKIPFLAVTMHPGIGTFELVGGYRPRELKIASDAEAKSIVGARLAQVGKGGDKGAFLDAAAKVYGAGDHAELEAKARLDLEHQNDPAAARRIVTLAHALRFGESSLVWQDGYLTYALKRDIWINFEELNAAPTEVLEFLNEFMRSRRLVVSQRLGHAEILSPKPGGRFMLWATMNPETDSNRNVLARTLKSRWRIKQFGELPSLETAQILEQTVGLPNSWALALAENVHKDMVAKARARTIGGDWRDGYVYNLRHLLRVARRWKYFVSRLPADKRSPTGVDSLKILAREAYSVYSAQIRERPEREAVFTQIDQALKLRDNGITFANLLPETRGFQDLGDRVRIGDVELQKGPGGPLAPKLDPDYVVDDKTWPRLYEYAKALAMGEPLLLMGESGVGKTTDLEYLFHVLNYPLHYKNLDSDTAHEEVVGGYVTGDRRGVYVFQEGMLPRAIEAGDGVLLDEINLNPLAEWMNTLIDDNSLYLPHRIVRGRPFLTGAANPPEPSRYGGRLLMSPAFRSRWHEFWVDDDSSEERYKFLMKSWLGGAMSAWGRAEAGVASWLDAVKDLAGRFSKKKSAPEVEPEPAPAEPEQGKDGEPATLEELLRQRKIPEGEWPGIERRVADVEAKIRMVGTAVGRDVSLEFAPGDAWAYWFDSNTITYPLDFLLTHSEDEVIGVVDHEGGHRDITVIDQNLPIVNKYLGDPERHFLWNSIEDPRVNNWVIKRLPGARHYLHALYDTSVPDEQAGPPPPPPDQSELDKILRKDAGAAFDPKVLGLPHVEFSWAIQYYWRHGKPPRMRSRSAREAFAKARPALDEIITNFPRSDDPRRGTRLAHTVKAIEQIDEKIWPLYQPLVERSKRKMARQMRGGGGKSGKQGKGQGQGQKGNNRGGMGNGMSMPEQNQPRPPKNSKNPPKNEQNKNGQGQGQERKEQTETKPDEKPGDGGSAKPGDEKKDDEAGQGKKKRSLWDRLTGKNKDEDAEDDYDDGAPEPGERRDQFDDKANEQVRKLAEKAAEDLKPKLPRAGSPRNGGRRGGQGQGGEPGSREAKPLSLADIVKTQREQLLNDSATPWQRLYRQVAEEANRMVSHLDNLFVKNSRPGDVGYFRSGRRPDMARAMRLDGRGGYRDDIWTKRVEATKRKYKVTLLMDESGSMKDKRHAALQAAVMLIESLHRLQVDVEIIGFAENAIVHLPYGTPVTPEKKEELLRTLSATVGERGATHDADAVKLALDRILQEDGDERIIFVVTDGEGNGPSKLDSVLPQAEAAKVGVIGIGIGAGMAYVEKAYKRSVLVPEYWGLPLAIKKEVEKFIADRELSAAKARRPGASMSLWTPALASRPARLPIPAAYRLATRVGGDKLRNAAIVGMIGSAFAVTVLTFSYPAAILTTLLCLGWVFFMSPGGSLEPDHVPAELEAKAAAVYYSMPAARRAEAQRALAAEAPPRRKGRLGFLWPRVGHPFAALAAGNDELRDRAWRAFKPFVADADQAAVLALAGSRLRRNRQNNGVTDGELAVLSSLGRPGRERLVALAQDAGLFFSARMVDAVLASVKDARELDPDEADSLHLFMLIRNRREAARYIDSRRRAPLPLDALSVEPGRQEDAALEARATAALLKEGRGFAEDLRAEEIERTVDAWRAAKGEERAEARARLEQLLSGREAGGAALASPAASSGRLPVPLVYRATLALGDWGVGFVVLGSIMAVAAAAAWATASIVALPLGIAAFLGWLGYIQWAALGQEFLQPERVPPETEARVEAVYWSMPPDKRLAATQALAAALPAGTLARPRWLWPAVGHPFQGLVSSHRDLRQAAWTAFKPFLRDADATASAALVPIDRLVYADGELEALRLLGGPGRERLKGILLGVAQVVPEAGLQALADAALQSPLEPEDRAMLVEVFERRGRPDLADRIRERPLEALAESRLSDDANDETLLIRAAAALTSPQSGLAGKLRAEEIERTVDAWRRARGDERAEARARLEGLLDGREAGGAALWTTASRPHLPVRPWRRVLDAAIRHPREALNLPWIAGAAVGYLAGGWPVAALGAGAGVVAALVGVLTHGFVPESWTRASELLDPGVEDSLVALRDALDPQARARVEAALSSALDALPRDEWLLPIIHPFAGLGAVQIPVREAAWNAAWPILYAEGRRRPEVGEAVLGALIAAAKKNDFKRTAAETLVEAVPLARGDESALTRIDHVFFELNDALGRQAVRLAREQARVTEELTRPVPVSEEAAVIARAKAALADPARGFAGSRRHEAVERALAELESAAPEAKSLARQKLESLLAHD